MAFQRFEGMNPFVLLAVQSDFLVDVELHEWLSQPWLKRPPVTLTLLEDGHTCIIAKALDVSEGIKLVELECTMMFR